MLSTCAQYNHKIIGAHKEGGQVSKTVVKSGNTVVGHVPYNLVPLFSHFLAREFNKGSVYVKLTGEKTNRGTGYGLEVPYIYHFCGPKAFVEHLKQKVASLRDRGLLPSSIDH